MKAKKAAGFRTLLFWAGIAIVVAILGFTGGSGGPAGISIGTIIASIMGVLSLYEMYYNNIADSAKDAYEKLCTPQYKF